jgi:hypothetical protein
MDKVKPYNIRNLDKFCYNKTHIPKKKRDPQYNKVHRVLGTEAWARDLLRLSLVKTSWISQRKKLPISA